MTKGRSPKYPQLTLTEAINRTQALYRAIHTYPAERSIIAQNLGYSGLNGKSLTVIGTLSRYGFLVSSGEGLAVSGDAVSIMELPSGNADRAKALEEAAYKPTLFAELQQEFSDKLPNDVTLRHHLIKKGFLPKAADEAIRIYRANLELVKAEVAAYNATLMTPLSSKTGPSPRTGEEVPRVGAYVPALPSSPSTEAAGTELRFKISRDSEARVSLTGLVTQEAIEKLAALLNLQKDAFPTKAELEETTDQKVSDQSENADLETVSG